MLSYELPIIVYYFAVYSGGECILKCKGTYMTVNTRIDTCTTVVKYVDDDGNHQKVTLSSNAVWTLEEEYHNDRR